MALVAVLPLAMVDPRPFVIVTDDLHAHGTSLVAAALRLDASVAGVRLVSGRWASAWRETMALVAYRLGVCR